MRERKIDEAIKALPHSTPGDWWCDDGGELHNDAVGSVKLAKYVSGGNPAQRDANRKILAAARDLAIEVERLRNQPPICMTKDELVSFLKENPEYKVPTLSTNPENIDEEAIVKLHALKEEWPEDGVSEDLMEYVTWGVRIGIRFMGVQMLRESNG
jgi:hypothetical protein